MNTNPRRYLTLMRLGTALAGMSCLVSGPALAQTQDSAAPRTVIPLQPIIVRATDDPPATGTIGQPPAAYAGGQAASGARLGLMGNRDVLRTPFSLSGYSSTLIANQQARSVGDVTLNNPSVRQDAPTFSERDSYHIRGFSVTNLDTLYDGLPYIVNPRRAQLEGIAAVEVLLGPTALAYGGTGRVGGTINLVPKRADDTPLTRLTTTYLSDAQLWTHLDVGRRFGAANEWGVRANAAYRGGDTAFDNNEVEVANATLGLDYRGDGVRASLDLVQSKQDINAPASLFNAADGTIDIPAAPDGNINTANPFEFNDSTYRMIAGRVEVDLQPETTLYGAFGVSRYREDFLTSNYTIINSNGDALNYYGYNPQEIRGTSAEIGLRSAFATGPVNHQLNVALTYSMNENHRGRDVHPSVLGFTAVPNPTNIYNPIYQPTPPDLSGLPRARDTIPFSDLRTRTLAISDTLSFMDDRIQLTLGARYTEFETRGFITRSRLGPIGQQNYDYKTDDISPAIAASAQVTEDLMVYANYVEALTEGPTAPAGTANDGTIFPATINKQTEIGAKYDFGSVAVTAALFEIRQPSGLREPSGVFTVNGEQRNRGLELSVFGQPADGIRILGGVTFLDADLTRTENGEFDGKRVPGVPRTALSLYGEVDTPWIAPDLTLTGRVIHNGSTRYDAANTQKVADWTRLDLGARYLVEAGGRDVELRANIENVLDENYWASSARGFLSTGAPRTFVLSAAMTF